MKDKIRTDFTARYERRLLDNTASFLNPRFKGISVTNEEEVKAILMQKCDEAPQQVEVAEQQRQEDQGGAKKKKKNRSEKPAVNHQV